MAEHLNALAVAAVLQYLVTNSQNYRKSVVENTG